MDFIPPLALHEFQFEPHNTPKLLIDIGSGLGGLQIRPLGSEHDRDDKRLRVLYKSAMKFKIGAESVPMDFELPLL